MAYAHTHRGCPECVWPVRLLLKPHPEAPLVPSPLSPGAASQPAWPGRGKAGHPNIPPGGVSLEAQVAPPASASGRTEVALPIGRGPGEPRPYSRPQDAYHPFKDKVTHLGNRRVRPLKPSPAPQALARLEDSLSGRHSVVPAPHLAALPALGGWAADPTRRVLGGGHWAVTPRCRCSLSRVPPSADLCCFAGPLRDLRETPS